MIRRKLLTALGLGSLLPLAVRAAAPTPSAAATPPAPGMTPLRLSDAQWKERLTPMQYDVLRKDDNERAGTSPLNAENRAGAYHCAG